MIPKMKFATGQTRALRGNPEDFIRHRLSQIETEEQVFELLDQVSAYAAQEGDYNGALLDSTIKYITRVSHNPVITRVLNSYCIGTRV